MAQDAVFRQAIGQRPLEGVDVVDALADEGALAEQILIHVGDGARVGVDAGFAAIQARVAGAVDAHEARGHAWLQDAVTLDHDPGPCTAAEARPVQGVRHRGHDLRRRVARQLCVGVQCDHVAHRRQRARVTDDARKALAGAHAGMPAQQCIQVGELAAFALMPHPDAFTRIPASRPMEQEEVIAAQRVGRNAVLGVQRGDARGGEFDQCVLLGQVFFRRIVQIGEQAEMQVRIAIGQIAHFERVGQRLHTGNTAQHGRHHHQRARFGSDAERVVHAR